MHMPNSYRGIGVPALTGDMAVLITALCCLAESVCQSLAYADTGKVGSEYCREGW